MDDHFKREGLEIFTLHQESVFYFIFSLKIFAILRKMTK